MKQLLVTQDASGRPVESEETVADNLTIQFWTDSSNVSNQNDQFVNQATGWAVLPPTLGINTTMWLEVDGKKHYIVGVDEVAGFGELLVVNWRREHG